MNYEYIAIKEIDGEIKVVVNEKQKPMKTHELKTIEPYFTAVWDGRKKFEVRKNDRDFKVGDKVHLKSYDAIQKEYTGFEIMGEITYILENYDAIQDGFVVFSFTKSRHISPNETRINKGITIK